MPRSHGWRASPCQFLATIQIGITLAGFLASAAAAVPRCPVRGTVVVPRRGGIPTAVVVTTLILAYLTLVFGELAPKRLALQRAEAWAMAMARPLAALTTATRPAVWLLSPPPTWPCVCSVAIRAGIVPRSPRKSSGT
ncbi:MAG: DUF21 domain-containing protein [Acidimicrobiales bacterium]